MALTPVDKFINANPPKVQDAKKFYKAVEDFFNAGLNGKSEVLSQLLSNTQGPIKESIAKKLSAIGEKGLKILDKINVLLKSLHEDKKPPLILLTPPQPHERSCRCLSSWIKNPHAPDLDEEQLEKLDSEFFLLYHPFLEEFHRLKKIDQDFVEKHLVCGDLSSLLHKAIEGDKPNILLYLIGCGANLNAVSSDHFSSSLIKAIELFSLASEAEKTSRFTLLLALLEHRKPIQKNELFNVIHFCCQHYKPDNEIFNMHLLDQATSLLLGKESKIREFFRNDRKLFTKFIAHTHDLKGTVFDDNQQPLYKQEGMHRIDYIRLRLRLFLQIVVECNRENSLKEEEFIALYNEFLSEIETAWLSQILRSWSRVAKNDEQQKQFFEALSSYILEQIRSLEDQQEYIFHGGWRAHSICVVFTKTNDLISVRIDNLGEGCERHPMQNGNLAQSKLIARLGKDSVNLLEDYLQLLCINASIDVKENEVNTVIQSIYSPKFKASQAEQGKEKYDWHPLQNVGNCTHASFSVGVYKRLGAKLFNNLEEKLMGALGALGRYFNKYPQETTLGNIYTEANLKMTDFASQFKKSLNQKYTEFFEKDAPPYIMNPSLCLSPYATASTENLIKELTTLLFHKNRIMIIGNAGKGKTFLSKKFSQEWQCNPTSKGIVLHLSLRNLSNAYHYPARQAPYTLLEIVSKELLPKPCSNVEMKLMEWELREENGTVWAVDGLDELVPIPSLENALKELMTKERIVITSRDTALPSQIQTTFLHFIHLMDYSQAEVYQYIDKYFAAQGKPEAPNKIKNALKINTQLAHICSIPITLNIICNLIKEGDERILGFKNITNVYDCFILSMLKNAYRRQYKNNELLQERQLHDRYRGAIRFSQRLAYSCLREYRKLEASEKLINQCLSKFQPAEIPTLFADLNEIGLLNINNSSAEFVHASFQEYFASDYLIRALKNPQKKGYHEGHSFIQEHKFDCKYKNLFSLMTHRLLAKTSSAELLKEYLSKFTTGVADDYEIGISLLEIYSREIAGGQLTEEQFLEGYSPFITSAYNSLFFKILRGNVKVNAQSFIASPEASFSLLHTFAALLSSSVRLRKELKLTDRLIENISQNIDDRELLNIFWNSLFFLQLTEGFSSALFSRIDKAIASLNTGKRSFLKGLLELEINQVKEIMAKGPLEFVEINSIISQIARHADLIYEISEFPNKNTDQDRCAITEKLIDLYAVISNYKVLDSYHLKSTLMKYTCVLIASDNLPGVALCWEKVTKVLFVDVQKLFTHPGLRQSIKVLKERIQSSYENALKTDNRSKPYRCTYFEEIGFALKNLLPITDFIDPKFGSALINKLIEIVIDGSKGNCSSRPAIRACSSEAWRAVMSYEPNDFPNTKQLHLERLKSIFTTREVLHHLKSHASLPFFQERLNQILLSLQTRDQLLFNSINEFLKN